jgi:hypothetical protein
MRDEITELLRRDPLVPFRIVLTGGQGYDVINPNLVSLGATMMHIFFPKSDRYAALRLSQIASTETRESMKRRRGR